MKNNLVADITLSLADERALAIMEDPQQRWKNNRAPRDEETEGVSLDEFIDPRDLC